VKKKSPLNANIRLILVRRLEHVHTELFTLSDTEFAQLQKSVPDDGSGSAVDRRAIALANIYLARRHPGCESTSAPAGADLAVRVGGEAFTYEVKGSRGSEIAPQKLKVSSLHCYNLLVAGTPILRIAGVFQRTPTVFIMQHGRDFTLRPEPRWSLHLVRARNA
jgi:hypothetical protein